MAVIDLTNNGARVYDIVALGMNDYLRDADLGVYGSNMSGIISHAQATGVQSVFVFNMPWTTAGSANGIDMNSIFSTAQSLASANKYDYADVVHDGPFANTAAIAAAGYYNPSDQIHLSDAGHNALWGLLQARLMTINYNWYPVALGAALVP
jgi:lysophospholipase L1-like esterase